jgi:hypothetical protein
MNQREIGPEYEKIAALMIDASNDEPGDLYLYAEAEPGAFGGSLYRKSEAKIYYIECTTEILEAIWHLWDSLLPDQQWSIMHMDVKGDSFDAHFEFTSISDEKEDGFDEREEAAVAARFGTTEIVYPDDN